MKAAAKSSNALLGWTARIFGFGPMAAGLFLASDAESLLRERFGEALQIG